MTYEDVVEILKISQDRPVGENRFENFKRAVADYGVTTPPGGEGIFLIAGTNGKGTVAKTLETLLGDGVGLFTSPHLMEPTERIRSRGQDLTQDEMVRAYEMVSPTVRKFDLSHFEILTLMMIEVFFGGRIRPKVSRAVIEVGVGGRLDPTRAIVHETAVLTRIGLDHEAILGSTLPLIAREKLAIAEGAKRLIYMRPDSSLKTIFDEAKMLYPNCEFIEAREFVGFVRRGPSHQLAHPKSRDRADLSIPDWSIETPWGRAALALLGERAVQNTSLALEVLAHSKIDVSSVLPRLKNVVWPGRMERISFRGREIFLSGDHNEQGVQSLVELLGHFRYKNLWLVVGIGKGKPIEAMLAHYQKIPRANLILTRTSFRPIDMSTLDAFKDRAVAIFDGALRALEFAAQKAGPNDLVVVSGSLYLVGDLRAALLQGRSDEGD